ncbi:MAG: GNAT family N-acetyltransferase, partial [Priestia megaterium]
MGEITFREAVREDLDQIVEMLADDMLGSKRERYELPLPDCYVQAFQAIDADPNNELI